MKTLCTIILVLFSSQVIAQRDCNYIKYKKSCNRAYISIIKDSSYHKGIEQLLKVKKKYGFLTSEEYMLAAFAYKKIDSSLLCAKNVKLAWSNHAFDWNYLSEYTELSPSDISKNFNSSEKQLVSEGFENFSKLEKSPFADSILKIINSMDSIDQVARRNDKKKSLNENLVEIKRVDSLNRSQFKEIVIKYGFPGEYFAPGHSSSIFPLLLHFADYPTYFKEMNSIFLEEVKKGRMSPTFYLYWLDRNLVTNENISKFCMFLPPGIKIKSIRRINKRRLKFGVNYGFPIPPKTLFFKE